MRYLTSDLINSDEREAVEAVLSSRNIKFHKLVELAGLDPSCDFQHSDLRGLDLRGADLRGFNFSHSDIRYSSKDKTTLIDETTIFHNSKIEWIHFEDEPIIDLMIKIDRAPNSDLRNKVLSELDEKFGKTDHVLRFIINAAIQTDDVEAYFDYLGFMPDDLEMHQSVKVADAGKKLLSVRFGINRKRRKGAKSMIFNLDSLIEKMERSDNSLLSRLYEEFASRMDGLDSTEAFKGLIVSPPERIIVESLNGLVSSSKARK